MGHHDKKLLTTLLFLTLIFVTLAKSVPGKGQSSIAHNENINDMFYKCHGYPCDVWGKVKENLKTIDDLSEQAFGYKVAKGNSSSDETLDGCVWPTLEQTEDIIRDLKQKVKQYGSKSRHKRDIDVNWILLLNIQQWELPIKYTFDKKKFSNSLKNIVRVAFKTWENETCVSFEEIDEDDTERADEVDVIITRNGTGCHSFMGKSGYRPQQINLDYQCFKALSVSLHEISHLLGVLHTHQRTDRNNFISINQDVINKKYRLTNWVRLMSSNYDTSSIRVPYDYSSVMHYSGRTGSFNRSNVIVANDPLFQKTLGQEVELSFNDIKIVNTLYCENRCNKNQLRRQCSNNGYQDPNNCEICKCVDGYSGKFCDIISPPKIAQCGGIISAFPNEKYTITSPFYGETYQDNTECTWLIKAPSNHFVQLEFEGYFDVVCGIWQQCDHWVEVRYKNKAELGPRFCCHTRPTEVFSSDTNEMMVLFRAKRSGAWNAVWQMRRGFQASFIAVPTGGSPIQENNSEEDSTLQTNNPDNGGIRSWSCGFEEDMQNKFDLGCNIEQSRDDQFDWTRQTGKTPSDPTGPDKAIEGSYYIFIEASNPRKVNDSAIITLPSFPFSGKVCVSFMYHMYGYHVNRLEVIHQRQTDKFIAWQKSGEQGNTWKSDSLTLDLRTDDKVGFAAYRGGEYSGDIAIDDIKVAAGTCE